MLAKVTRQARRVRRAAAQFAPALSLPPTLPGFCPIAAVSVLDALRDVGVGANLIAGWFVDARGRRAAHFWVDADTGPGRGVFVDITATQFRPSWPGTVVLSAGDKRLDRYHPIEVGDAARERMWREDADLLRLLPHRWWLDPLGPGTLDARVLATLLKRPKAPVKTLGRKLGVKEPELYASLARLASRSSLSHLPSRVPSAAEAQAA